MKQDRIIELSKLLEQRKEIREELKYWESGNVKFCVWNRVAPSRTELDPLHEITPNRQSKTYEAICTHAIKTLNSRLLEIDTELEEA